MVASVLYTIGCVVGYFIDLPYMFIPAIPMIAIAFLPNARRFRTLLLTFALFLLGIANFSFRWNQLLPVNSCDSATITGTVCGTPFYNTETERLILLLDDVSIDNTPQTGKLRLYLRNNDDPALLAASAPEIGCTVECTAHIWEASSTTNPGQFNFSNYLRINGIIGYATCKQEFAVFGETRHTILNLPARIRSSLASHIDQLFPKQSAIARAFLIGDRSQLTDEDRDAFSSAGIAHILAISGMHISLLSYALMLLLNRFLSRKTSFGISLFLLVLYGALIGFPASLFRALLMFAVLGYAAVEGRASDPITSLAFSMMIYLMVDPIKVLSTGFSLSYGATAGIILLYHPVSALFHAESLLSRRIEFRSHPFQFLGKWIVSLFVLTLTAQVAILPIIVYSYGVQSIVSFIVGIPAIPIAMIAYIIAIPATILGFYPLATAADNLFSLLSSIAHLSAKLPVVSIRIARFPFLIILLWIITCMAASDLSKINLKVRRFFILLIIPAIIASDLCAYIASIPTGVMFMDAGQADCAVIQTRGKIFLVDTGDSYSPVADYLSAGNYSVEGIFISHPHADHTGGINDILELCTPKKIYISANYNTYSVDNSVIEALNNCTSAGSELITVSEGDIIPLSSEAEMKVFAPEAGFQTDSANEDSLLLQLVCGETSVLFTGDASAETIKSVAPDSDVLKVAHHGSSLSLDSELLEAVSPSACIISVGYNSYGHPAQESLDLISLSQAALYRTDQCGAITCRLDPKGIINISTYLKQEDPQ